MNHRNILRVISFLTMVIGVSMFTAVPVSWLMKDSMWIVLKFSGCAAVCCSFGLAGVLLSRIVPSPRKMAGLRDGFASVIGAWFSAVFFAALPFILVGGLYPVDSFFETASGLSTTGATVIDSTLILRNGRVLPNGLESLPSGLLYWRCLLNWLGGIGIVVFALLVLPLLGGAGGQQLYNAEVPGVKTISDQVLPRLQDYAKLILFVYMLLTLFCVLAFYFSGMNVFDAICHSFSTISTGGFSTKNASFGYYTKPLIQWVAIFFMLISACNFPMTLKMFVKRKVYYLKDEEFRFFLLLIFFSSLLIGWMLYRNFPNGLRMTSGITEPHTLESALRCSVFQVVSTITTTGFITADYSAWAIPGALMILFLLCFPGGCGGSTSGGMKCVRILLVVKHAFFEIRHCLFPRLIPDVRLNGKRLSDAVIRKVMAFMALYLLILVLAALLLSFLTQTDLLTAISASISCLSNIGPGFGKIGPAFTFSWMSAPAKILLAVTMIAGRLELYTFLVFFLPSFWKK